MLIEEEEVKGEGEVNADALEAAIFDADDTGGEEDVFIFRSLDEEEDEVDIAFEPNPENYW